MAKKEQVIDMFDNIAFKYDFLNHFLSMHIDKIWRHKAVKKLRNDNLSQVLDVATGTADLALHLYKKLRPGHITGIDISENMIEIGRRKISRENLTEKIDLQYGDSEEMPFEDNCFDAVVVAFGVRNFENLDRGLSEMYRVLKPGSRIVILEFSVPGNKIFRTIFNFYFRNILPAIGRIVSKDTKAYNYLPESVEAFPYGAEFMKKMTDCGFHCVDHAQLSFGIAGLYTGIKMDDKI